MAVVHTTKTTQGCSQGSNIMTEHWPYPKMTGHLHASLIFFNQVTTVSWSSLLDSKNFNYALKKSSLQITLSHAWIRVRLESVSTGFLSLLKGSLDWYLKESFQWNVLTFYWTTVENTSIPAEYLTPLGFAHRGDYLTV